MYVGAAFGPEECAVHMDLARKRWERANPGRASLTFAYHSPDWDDIVWLYGPYVMLEMLRTRIGNEPFFLALDVMLREHAHDFITTERLQHYLEQASGRDLKAFFDFWVHQGIIPAISLTWDLTADGRIEGTVRSDVPFGTFDVPIHLRGPGGAVEVVWVDVVDGAGTLTAGPFDGPREVHLDPDGRVLARARKVSRARSTP